MKIIILSISLLVLFTGLGQKKSKTPVDNTKSAVSQYEDMYKTALRLQDGSTAIVAAFNIIAIQGAESVYKDSLAYLYFSSNNALSCHLLCKELLIAKPANQDFLEMNAVCLKSLGRIKESIEAYEALFALSNKRMHAYELATLQFSLKRSSEAFLTAQNALLNTESTEDKVYFEFNDSMQYVPIDGAFYNLLGLISYDMKSEENALSFFKKALEVFPEFYLAEQNKVSIETLKK